MDELKSLNRLISMLTIDESMMDEIENIESEAAKVNDKLCKHYFNGDERFMKAFIKISKFLKNDAKVELDGDDSIRIYREWKEGKWMDCYEIYFRYIANAEGSKCFQQTYSNIQDFDGHTPHFDENEPLIDKYDVIEYGRNI